MLFLVRSRVDLNTREALQRESERRMHFATDRFTGRIREISVVLSDINGPRGGLDKKCRVVAKLSRGNTLEVEETRSSFVDAIRQATKRFRSLLFRRIGGKQPRNTSRHGAAGATYTSGWSIV